MTEHQQEFESRIDLSSFAEKVNAVRQQMKKIIVGQEKVIDLLIIALLSDGHVLIEGVPGVAKTLMANLLAKTIDTEFQRIQFTPDLMPSDIIGTSIYNDHKGEFQFKKGPVFSNIILIDEINRSPAKTQSALFEVMEERNITVEGHTFEMTYPFFVIGTQNPIEHEGTYRLPEAQTDRFFFRIKIDFPSMEQETMILKKFNTENYQAKLDKISPALNKQDLKYIREKVNEIHVEEQLFGYIAKIVQETRENPDIFLGASPRASLAILKASKAVAAFNGRDFVTPEDIKFVVPPALNHRIILNPEKEIEGISTEEVIQAVLKKIEIPR